MLLCETDGYVTLLQIQFPADMSSLFSCPAALHNLLAALCYEILSVSREMSKYHLLSHLLQSHLHECLRNYLVLKVVLQEFQGTRLDQLWPTVVFLPHFQGRPQAFLFLCFPMIKTRQKKSFWKENFFRLQVTVSLADPIRMNLKIWTPITRTLGISNSPLTRSRTDFPWICFIY